MLSFLNTHTCIRIILQNYSNILFFFSKNSFINNENPITNKQLKKKRNNKVILTFHFIKSYIILRYRFSSLSSFRSKKYRVRLSVSSFSRDTNETQTFHLDEGWLIDRSEKIYTIYWAHIIINHEDSRHYLYIYVPRYQRWLRSCYLN